jgi:hypothetical protein
LILASAKSVNNQSESNAPNDDITFHSVDVETGRICHRKTFLKDYFLLEYHNAVDLYDCLFGTLSFYNQEISVMQIRDDGMFWDLVKISTGKDSVLKQRILRYLYFDPNVSRESFFRNFDYISNLYAFRFQFLDHERILLKFGDSDCMGRNVTR